MYCIFDKNKHMKVLFIGGTGNISSAVSRVAVSKGIDLYHLNRGNKESIKGVKQIHADIKDVVKTKQLLSKKKWDVVVNWIAFTVDDVNRDFELFAQCTKQYIFISSASAYQKPPVNPIITESTPLVNPFWEYSRNKIACEEHLMHLYRTKDFPITIVRPSHTYNTVIPITLGGWTEYTTVDRMKKGLPVVVQGDGTSLWTLTHAKDFAQGFIGLLGNIHTIGEAFHITSDEILSWNQIYETLAEALDTKANIVHIPTIQICKYADEMGYPSEFGSLWGDKSHCAIFDNSKIKRFVPEYKAVIPFSEGIKETIKWFEARAERMIINDATNKFLDGLIKKWG